MIDKGGAIHFEITVSDDDLKRKLAESRQAILNSGQTAEAEGAKIEGVFKRAAMGINTATMAQKALNIAMNANNVMGVISLLIEAGSAIYQFASSAKGATEELTPLEKATKSAGEEFDQESAKVQALADIMNNSNVAYDERKRALEGLKSLVPGYNGELDNEGILINNNTSAIKDYLVQLEKQMKIKAIQGELEEAYKNDRVLEKDYKGKSQVWSNMNTNSAYHEKPTIDILGMFNSSDLQRAEKDKDEAWEKINDSKKLIAELNAEIVSTSNANAGLPPVFTSYSQQLQSAAKDVTVLKEQLKNLKAGDGQSSDFAKDIKETEQQLQKAQTTYDTLAGVDKKVQVKQSTDLHKMLLDLDRSFQQSKFTLMKDGQAKQLQQIENETKSKIDAVNDQYAQVKRAQGGKLTTEQSTKQNETVSGIRQDGTNQSDSVKQKYAKEFSNMQHEMTMVQASEEEKRTVGIRQKYEQQRIDLSKLLDENIIGIIEYGKVKKSIDDNEKFETLAPLLKGYQTYTDRRKEIENKFNADIKTLQSNNKNGENDAKIAQVQKTKKQSLSKVDLEETKKGLDFSQLFGNLDEQTLPSMKSLRDKIKAWIDSAGDSLSADDLKSITDKFNELDLKITGEDPFAELHDSFKTLKTATESAKTAQAEYNTTLAKGNKDSDEFKSAEEKLIKTQSDRAAAEDKAQQALSSSAGKGQQVVGMAQDVMNIMGDLGVKVPEEITGAIGGIGQVMDGLASIDITNPMSIITGGIKVIGGLVKSITSVFNGDNKKEKEIQGLQKNIDALDVSYQDLDGAIASSYSNDASEMIGQQNVMLEQQKVLIQNQIAAEQSKKNTDNTQIEAWQQQLTDIDKTLAVNKEKASDAIFGEDLKSAIENFSNAYADAWANGEDRSKAAKDTVRTMMRQMVTESIKAAVDSSDAMVKIREKLEEFYEDGVLTAVEQDSIYKMAEDLQAELDSQFGWADSLMKDDKPDEEQREATKKGIATASQESVDENNGRLTAIQGHTFELNENMKLIRPDVSSIKESMTFIRDNAAAQLIALHGIQNNTAPITEMRVEMGYMRADMNSIVVHGVKIR